MDEYKPVSREYLLSLEGENVRTFYFVQDIATEYSGLLENVGDWNCLINGEDGRKIIIFDTPDRTKTSFVYDAVVI